MSLGQYFIFTITILHQIQIAMPAGEFHLHHLCLHPYGSGKVERQYLTDILVELKQRVTIAGFFELVHAGYRYRQM